MSLRWGILGTARINRRVIPAMRLARRSEVAAVASRDRARAESYAAEWNIPRAVAGYQTLLDDSSIDAVYIPLPNTDHVPWTLAAVAPASTCSVRSRSRSKPLTSIGSPSRPSPPASSSRKASCIATNR